MKSILLIISVLLASVNCFAQPITITTTENDIVKGTFINCTSRCVNFKDERSKPQQILYSHISSITGDLSDTDKQAILYNNNKIAFKENANNDYKEVSVLQNDSITVTDQLNYMRSCLGHYHKVRQSAFLLSGLTLATSGLSVATNEKAFLVVGGVSSLASVVLFITAEKWLKSASIKPSKKGFGIVFEF